MTVVARNGSGRLSALPDTHGLRVPLLVRSSSGLLPQPGGLRSLPGLVPSPGTQRRDRGAESGYEADSDKQYEIGQFGLS